MTLLIATAGALALTRALPGEARVIDNMMQLYTHDFSEFWAGTARGDLNSEGLFEPYSLEGYWSRPNWSALFIWHNRVLAGFSLINDQTHTEEPVDRNVGEFFILRKHRGQGVGRLAAELVFSSHTGSWEIAVARKNMRAAEFWRRTVHNSGRAADIREMDLQTGTWNGPILRFNWH